MKDLNNELDPYIGIYKTTFQNREITLYINKVEDKLEKRASRNFYRDALVVKFIVKNSAGISLIDTQNMNVPKNEIYSFGTRSFDNSVYLYYSGTNCGVGWGDILIKKINTTQLSWVYSSESRILHPGNCPGNPDLTVYLPEAMDPVIFTKQ